MIDTLTQLEWMNGLCAGVFSASLEPAAIAPGASAAHATGVALGSSQAFTQTALLIPLLPLLSVVLIMLCAIFRVKSKLPAYITVASLAVAFGITVWVWQQVTASPANYISHGYEWINFRWGNGPGQHFAANFSLYIDQLTCFWMLFVTGLGALIALYASEYMSHDVGPGYCRFFAAFSLFVFSMACLVMGDNLLLLFLGWEGVGLCSYLLIGYFYKKPVAVEAAKKAFIVNRIGDLGLLMGILTTFAVFGSVEYREIFQAIHDGKTSSGVSLGGHWAQWVIPLLFTAGAFGKSAQIFFYVWLPDAMEGPTPVSALIHAATMVTAGVYLIARLYPIYTMDEVKLVLSFVAWSGAITAFWAATIAMAQYDIKRIMGYSTISQLGFMFAGLGVLTTTGAAYHVFTHAFFKATLFLCCGAVMHGFAGQLDLRKLSGVARMKGWGIVGIAMLVGCLNLAGIPGMAGYFSKDMILAQAFVTPEETILGSSLVGWLLLVTALLTAYYTFRVFFRVFVGPQHYESGDELHAAHDDHDHADAHGHGAAAHAGHGHGGSAGTRLGEAGHLKAGQIEAGHAAHHDFHPHAPGWAINFVLVVLSIASLAAAGAYFIHKEDHGWTGSMLKNSSAAYSAPGEHHDASHAAPHATPHSAPHATRSEPVGGGVGEASAAATPATIVPHNVSIDEIDESDATVPPRAHEGELGTFFGFDPHVAMYFVSGGLALVGIFVAYLLHYRGRTEAATSPGAESAKKWPVIRMLEPAARRKWYVDEIYNFTIRVPLLVAAHIFHIIDKLLVDGVVNLAGAMPFATGHGVRPSQSGILNSYAVAMGIGIGLFVLIAVMAMS